MFFASNQRYASNTQQWLNFVLIDVVVAAVVYVVVAVVAVVDTKREDLGKNFKSSSFPSPSKRFWRNKPKLKSWESKGETEQRREIDRYRKIERKERERERKEM